MFPNNFTSNQVSTVSWESVDCFSNCTCNLTVEDQTQMSSLCSGPYFGIPVWQKMLTDHQLCTQYQQSGCKECLGSPAPLPTPSTAVAITESGGWGWSPPALGGCYREGFFYHSSWKSYWIASRCQNVTASIYSGWHSSFVSCFINIWHVLEHFIAWNVFKKSEREESFLLVPRMSDHPRAAAAATAVPFSPWGTQFINVLLSPIYLFVCFELLWSILSDIKQQELLYRTAQGEKQINSFLSRAAFCQLGSSLLAGWAQGLWSADLILVCILYLMFSWFLKKASAFQWTPFSLALSLYPSAFYLLLPFFFFPVGWLGVDVKD